MFKIYLWYYCSNTKAQAISQRGLQNVRNQCEFPVKHLREATANCIRYLMFEACFMPSRCSISFFQLKFTFGRVYVVVKTWICSEWRCLQNEDGVENTLGLQNIHSLCFAQIIILIWWLRCRGCRVVDKRELSSASVEVDFNKHHSFLALRPRTHGNVFLRFCIVSSNELIVLDHPWEQ